MSSHDRSACLLRDGSLVCAIAEERLDRRKRSPGNFVRDTSARIMPPVRAIRYVLEVAKTTLSDVDVVVCGRSTGSCRQDLLDYLDLDPQRVFEPNSHHLAHAYSAFGTSPFEEAAVLVADEQGTHSLDGSYEKISLYCATRNGLCNIASHRGDIHNISLGMFFNIFCALTGLYEAGLPAPGKLMALAAYGSPSPNIEHLIEINDDTGNISIPIDRIDKFLKSLKHPQRYALQEMVPENFDSLLLKYEPIHWSTDLAKQLACQAQTELERTIISVASVLQRRTQSNYLCYAGGIALNCLTNSKLLRAGYRDVYVHPAATDDGTAIGLAYFGLIEVLGYIFPKSRWVTPYLGKTYGPRAVDAALAEYSAHQYGSNFTPEAVAGLLAQGRIVCWMNGPSEWGPRALGNRSVFADSRSLESTLKINREIKHRESFRPVGIAILRSAAEVCLDLDGLPLSLLNSMLVTAPVRKDAPIAVGHVDGSTRVQLVEDDETELSLLLAAFSKVSGIGCLVNTSFNFYGEPLVETPLDAVRQFLISTADALVIGDILLQRSAIDPAHLADMQAIAWKKNLEDPARVAYRLASAGFLHAAQEVAKQACGTTIFPNSLDEARSEEDLLFLARLAISRGDPKQAIQAAQAVLEILTTSGKARSTAAMIESYASDTPLAYLQARLLRLIADPETIIDSMLNPKHD